MWVDAGEARTHHLLEMTRVPLYSRTYVKRYAVTFVPIHTATTEFGQII